ncbi:LacI family transcriptional regulator [Trebonia kvetii]|uniref:LacI family transcriptional regulator n=1 Tax=Trebonia kvetii TaxID=2480626 RepID=A0A6P2C4D8_9ACTN|nr:LacI family DNA-binding transcriptional regulator [Trebonia kvetii]TVZ05365.1 LacI family transcriptional regulator [Trebonia kvetii]
MTVTDSITEPTGPPTLADVARLAGVSSATASRVLTGSARVQVQTKDKVEQAMTMLGYARNRAARSAGSRRAGAVALIVGEETIKVFADPFFARMLRAVNNELSTADSQLVVLTLHSPREYQAVSRYLRSGHVDGALFVSMHGRPDFDYQSLGIPLVLCGRPVAGGGALAYVDADNIGGARTAVRYLLDSGRKAVATIAGPPDMAPGIDRLLGYRQALGAAAVLDPGMIAYGDFSAMSGQHALFRLIDHRPGIDAVFAASDLMAAGALHALRRLGRRVPRDVAVIGFDGLPAAQQTDPQLTTVRQPVAAMGTCMVSELLAQIADPGRKPAQVVLGTELILRGSA